MRAIEQAGGIPVVLPPLRPGRGEAAARGPRGTVPVRRPGPLYPAVYGAEPASRAGPVRARHRPLRAGRAPVPPGDGTAHAGDLPRCPDPECLPQRNPASSTCRTSPMPIQHRQPEPNSQVTHEVEVDRAERLAGPDGRRRNCSRSTPSTTRQSIASATTCARRPGRPTEWSRQSRRRTAPFCLGRAVARRVHRIHRPRASGAVRARWSTPPASRRRPRRRGRAEHHRRRATGSAWSPHPSGDAYTSASRRR